MPPTAVKQLHFLEANYKFSIMAISGSGCDLTWKLTTRVEKVTKFIDLDNICTKDYIAEQKFTFPSKTVYMLHLLSHSITLYKCFPDYQQRKISIITSTYAL